MRHSFFKKTLFFCCCNGMEEDWQKIFEKQKVLISLKNSILKFIRQSQNSVYDFRNPKGSKCSPS